MEFDKVQALKELRRKEVLFCSKLNPENLLPYLPSLSDQSKEEIKCEQRNYGEKRAATLLLKRIQQKDRCLYDFIRSLRNEDIFQSELADILDPNHFYDTGQEQRESPLRTHSYSESKDQYKTVSDKKTISYDSHTPIRLLPYKGLQKVYRLDYDEKWKDLAAHLEYSLEEVQKLQIAGHSRGCTEKLIEEWSNVDKPTKANLENLFVALDKIERLDIISDLEEILNYKFQKPCETDTFLDDPTEPYIPVHGPSDGDNTGQRSGYNSLKEGAAQSSTLMGKPSELMNTSDSLIEKHPDSLTQENNCVTQPSPDTAIENVELYSPVGMFSMENNEQQDTVCMHDRKIQNSRIPIKATADHHLTMTDAFIDAENNNTKFVEKNMKDKVIEMAKEKPVFIGATVALGACALFGLLLKKSV